MPCILAIALASCAADGLGQAEYDNVAPFTVGSEGGSSLIAEEGLFSCRRALPNRLQRRRPTTQAAAIQEPTVQAPRTT